MSHVSDKDEARLVAIAEELRAFIANDLGRHGVSCISIDDDLFGSGVLDSMGVVEVMSFCEARYQFTFDLSVIGEETFSSLRRLAGCVASATSHR